MSAYDLEISVYANVITMSLGGFIDNIQKGTILTVQQEAMEFTEKEISLTMRKILLNCPLHFYATNVKNVMYVISNLKAFNITRNWISGLIHYSDVYYEKLPPSIRTYYRDKHNVNFTVLSPKDDKFFKQDPNKFVSFVHNNLLTEEEIS